ncbi:hypothetical protein G4O51_00155 [Candidatus Bathyarchaeota archaeon A05DMB-2]|nr:hypothetical protein [Candidatus Bathyarchaeota archaeon A05DMB-2]
MTNCLHRNATVPEEAVNCGNYEVAKPQTISQGSSTSPTESDNGDMAARLEKAMRRAELLSYAAAALAVAILAAIIGIAFL